VSLRGNTFDASHLDKFLNSGFGEKSISSHYEDKIIPKTSKLTNRSIGPGGGGGSNIMSYLASNSS